MPPVGELHEHEPCIRRCDCAPPSTVGKAGLKEETHLTGETELGATPSKEVNRHNVPTVVPCCLRDDKVVDLRR